MAIVFIILWILVLVGIGVSVVLLLGLPLRRQHRALMFLDLLETGLDEGNSPERTIISAAESHDQSINRRLMRAAHFLKSGMRLSQALMVVSRVVPEQIVATLVVGEKVGDLRKVLPACRQKLANASSQTTAAQNYLVILPCVINPIIVILPFLMIFIFPKILEMVRDLYESHAIPPLLALVFAHQTGMIVIEASLAAGLFTWLFFFVFGHLLIRKIALLRTITDKMNDRVPWRRKRLQRDFSSVLSILLDNGLPESVSLQLAAESTANMSFIRRASIVADALERGVPLTKAIQSLDDTGEFQWRLTNAIHEQGGFVKALAGWHDFLEAKAYQQEQTAAQFVSTTMILINGFLVGLIVIAVFQIFIVIIQEWPLW